VYFAEGILKDRAQAKDAVATVFESLWNRGEWESVKYTSTYLYRAVLNTCQNINFSNKAREKRQSAPEAIPEAIDDAILERIYRAEVYRELYSALEKLSEQCRLAMQLSYIEGNTGEETARIMNISSGAVKTYRVRGIKQLRKTLSRQAFMLLLL